MTRSAVLFVRARGWHLEERHMLGGRRADVGLDLRFRSVFFHNAKELLARGQGPYFYLPKMESHLEARLWNDVFLQAQAEMRIAEGLDQGNGADRDHPGQHLRWTRSCTSCASTRRG